MGVFTQVARNIQGFAHKFACKSAYASCVNGAEVCLCGGTVAPLLPARVPNTVLVYVHCIQATHINPPERGRDREKERRDRREREKRKRERERETREGRERHRKEREGERERRERERRERHRKRERGERDRKKGTKIQMHGGDMEQRERETEKERTK